MYMIWVEILISTIFLDVKTITEGMASRQDYIEIIARSNERSPLFLLKTLKMKWRSPSEKRKKLRYFPVNAHTEGEKLFFIPLVPNP
mgnify:CR=1 FL=1